MATTTPSHYKYSELISEIEKGQVKIPQFQREFVWDLKGSARLLDSIFKNYPIGTFIFWRTNDRLRSIRNIGNLDLPEPRDGEFITYVLDGQQRITSLFASLKGVKIKRDGKHETDYSKIYIDLVSDEENTVVITDTEGFDAKSIISVKDLIEQDFDLLATYSKDMREKIKQYRSTLESYDFSVIEVKNAEIEVATDIFTRINVGGRSLSLFEIMVAKTYDIEKDFDLAQKYIELLISLAPSHYETISAATVLQTLAMIYKKDCTRKEILKIPKADFIEMWDATIDSIKATIDYFRSYYRIPVSRLLPYNALIVPFSYYFYKQKVKPTGEVQRRLEDFFWRASLGARYSSGVESKLASDIEKIEKFIKNEPVKYEWSINTTAQFIEDNGYFRTGRSYIKAILSIYASLTPLSFDDNAKVTIDNSWLKIASSKNYHHFFPKAFLKKTRKDIDEFYVNHIANITIVDDYLNKNKIRAKAPSKYIGAFSKDNPDINNALKTHLIGAPDKVGIVDDDYDKFFSKRISLISKELEKRVILTDADNVIEGLDEDTEVDNISDEEGFEE
jgi:hypothetical protein